ncbi:hypothetical protein D3C86_2264580 [compost metagenome]
MPLREHFMGSFPDVRLVVLPEGFQGNFQGNVVEWHTFERRGLRLGHGCQWREE